MHSAPGFARKAAGTLVLAFLSALAGRAQVVTWVGGTDQNYLTPGNWSGGIVPTNGGTNTIDLSTTPNGNINLNTDANVLGLVFESPGSMQYNIGPGSPSGTLTIGSGGITLQESAVAIGFFNAPVILSADQTWQGGTSGFIFFGGGVGETGGPQTLTIQGRVYLTGQPDTYSGGTVIDTGGTLNAGEDAAAGTGGITMMDSAEIQSFSVPVNIPNAVTLGNNDTLQTDSATDQITFSGPITLGNPATSLLIGESSPVVITGNISASTPTTLHLIGQGAQLPNDGGSQLVFTGSISQISGVSVDNAALILEPSSGGAATSLLGLSTLDVTNQGYLGLDGAFTQEGNVSAFIAAYGGILGPSINGTLGFDTFESEGTNVYNDPINLSQFSSGTFIGLGSQTAAILSASAVITPISGTNEYRFGGGGGTLTVRSPLADSDGTGLTMNGGAEPLTLLLQGTNTYMGATQVNGGVLIFDSPLPPTSSITLAGGYVGYTEMASNVAAAQDFVSMVAPSGTNVVIGFDSTDPEEPRTINDPIDLSGFGSGNYPFLGTATAVTLAGTITPNSDFNNYYFTGVKGGALTVIGNLTSTGAGLTIGLPDPIEANGSISSVSLDGDNSAIGSATLNSGIVFIDNSAALGSGTITVPDTGSATTAPVLAPFAGGVSLTNPISVGSITSGMAMPGLTLGNSTTTDVLTLSGVISDFMGQSGFLGIQGHVTLTGANTYSGGTNFIGTGNAVALVGNNSALGSGSVNVVGDATIAPAGVDVTLGNSIVFVKNMSLTLGSPENSNLLTLSGIISGNGNVIIDSNVELDGVNTYVGSTVINDATVTIGNSSAFGTGPVTLVDSIVTDAFANPTETDLVGDSDSTINLISGATLTLNTDLAVEQPALFQGSISGDGTNVVIKTGVGAEELTGDSSYGGGTMVNQGTLIVGSSSAVGMGTVQVASGAQLQVGAGAALTNVVTAAPGSILGGTGTFAPTGGASISGGQEVEPGGNTQGAYTGTLTFSTGITFGSGGIYGFNVQDAGGSAGTDWTTLTTTSLNISSTAGSPFTIMVTSISPGGGPGLATFNATQAYSWAFANYTMISGFAPDKFTIDTSAFQNSFGTGMFTVADTGESLVVNFTPVPEPSTWLLMAAGTAALFLRARRRKAA